MATVHTRISISHSSLHCNTGDNSIPLIGFLYLLLRVAVHSYSNHKCMNTIEICLRHHSPLNEEFFNQQGNHINTS